ncbi:hypothetical protein Q6A51_20515 [Pseudomonas sp. KFB-139]|uniref:Uncharacterized protein n=1 Tax=Pseudomonas serbiensis TaxID=3064350 RepID=A0ABT9CUK3_9PSED|nr:hypothetical protein [Pseudomonas sp. KFB-138]MDO7929173.1 hypothetical protein [Pseudomonas sp. KFB-138]
MKSENEVSPIKKVVVDTLPCELVVAGFAEEYAQYLEHYKNTGQNPLSLPFLLLGISAWLMILVGFFTIVFGPEVISYDSQTGPTFGQIIQIYPGPIVSVGVLLLTIGKFFDSDSSGALLTPELFLLAFYELQLPEGPENLAEVSIAHVDGALFQINRA